MVLPRIAIASINVGRAAAGHTMHQKLAAAARAGFEGFEPAFECLDFHAKAMAPGAAEADALRLAAHDIRRLADEVSIEVMALQPFMRYDAILDWGPRFKEGLLWIELCDILGAKILQIPTCTYPIRPDQINVDPGYLASNIRRLADAAAPHGIVLAYEAPAWGMAATTWQEIDHILKLVDRPNAKHCLDTFHIAAVVCGDPTSPDTGYLRPESLLLLDTSLNELRETLMPSDISYFQLSDANKVDLTQSAYPVVDLAQPHNMTWSRNCRIYPTESGSVLPSVEVCQAVFATGFRGWTSMEVFHADLYNSSSSIPDEWAQRGMASWRKVVELCGLEK